MRADLAVDVRDVPRNGADAKHKFTGDFGIGAAGGDQAEDLDLPSREGRDKRALDARAALGHPRASGLHVCRSYSIAPGHSGPNVNQVCRKKLGTRTINVLVRRYFRR